MSMEMDMTKKEAKKFIAGGEDRVPSLEDWQSMTAPDDKEDTANVRRIVLGPGNLWINPFGGLSGHGNGNYEG